MIGGALVALLNRDYLITRSYRLAFVMDVFYGVVNVAVYYFISRTFDEISPDNLGGAPTYFAFAVVGTTITAVIGSASSGIASSLREEQLTGTLEALVTQPARTEEVALGLAGFPCVYAFLRSGFYLLVAIAVFDLDVSQASWLGFLVLLLASGIAMIGIGIAAGAVTIVFKRGQTIAGVAIFAMGIVSGAVFPIAVLPDWLQSLGKVMPTRFAFDGTRAALFRGENWLDDAVVLSAFGLVTVPIALWLFGRAIDHVRGRGTLAQY